MTQQNSIDSSVLIARPSDGGEAILGELIRENGYFAQGYGAGTKAVNPSHREGLALDGQTPIAAIIACADSRVAPELIFRAKLGDLFVIRVAGSTPCGPEVMGSVEYAVDHLNVPLVIVLGHTGCGAVKAACGGGDPLPGMLGEHITAMAKHLHEHKHLNADPVLCNVMLGVNALNKGKCIQAAKDRGVLVTGAVYEMDTGLVSIIDDGEAGNKAITV